MIHQRDECRISVGDSVRQRPHAAERAVDNLRFHVGVQQQHADIDDIERCAQRKQLTHTMCSPPFASPALFRAASSLAASAASNARPTCLSDCHERLHS